MLAQPIQTQGYGVLKKLGMMAQCAVLVCGTLPFIGIFTTKDK